MGLRRYKKRKEDQEVFSASQFRRSAVLLDDEMDNSSPYSHNGFNNGNGSGYNTTLRPPTMIERHMNNSPASFAHPQYAGYAPQPPPPSFGPGDILGPSVYTEQEIRSAAYDGDPFAVARDSHLNAQASGEFHPDYNQYDYQQFPAVPSQPGTPQQAMYPNHNSYNQHDSYLPASII